MTSRGTEWTGCSVSDDGPVVVRSFEESDQAAWNAFVFGHADGTFFHRAEWSQVLERAFRLPTHYLLAQSITGEITGVLPLAHSKSILFGNALVSTPFCVYGGILANDAAAHLALERAACHLARDLDVDYLEMRNRSRRHPSWPCKDLYVTFRKSFETDPEKNLLAIPRKQRAMVRKGVKEQLKVEVDADVDRHYDIYSDSLRNLGTPVFSKKYLRVLKNAFGDACEIVTILKGDRAIASVLSFYFRNEVIPYYGGGTSGARQVAGNDFMYWAVMERAREKGLALFDYGRSKRGSGSFEFKEHWGFAAEPLYYEYFLVRKHEVPNLSPTNPKYAAAISLWRKLPLWLTQILGPIPARYLG